MVVASLSVIFRLTITHTILYVHAQHVMLASNLPRTDVARHDLTALNQLTALYLACGYTRSVFEHFDCVDYGGECCISSPVKVAIAMDAWRLLLALVLSFAIRPWEKGFGMAAINALLARLIICVVACKEQALRSLQLVVNLQATEDEMYVIKEAEVSQAALAIARGLKKAMPACDRLFR